MSIVIFRILMEKTLMEEESAWSTQEAVVAAEVEVEDATLEVETVTGVDLVGGGRLAPGLDTAS